MLTVHLFTAPWVPLTAEITEAVKASCERGEVELRVHDADSAEAERHRVVTVPTVVVVDNGVERSLRGVDVIKRLDSVIKAVQKSGKKAR